MWTCNQFTRANMVQRSIRFYYICISRLISPDSIWNKNKLPGGGMADSFPAYSLKRIHASTLCAWQIPKLMKKLIVLSVHT